MTTMMVMITGQGVDDIISMDIGVTNNNYGSDYRYKGGKYHYSHKGERYYGDDD